jgi:YggT family protein
MVREFVSFAFSTLTWMIIIRAILSWIPSLRDRQIYRSLVEMTETFISPIRKLLPHGNSMVDFAPLVTILLIQLLENLVLSVL